MNSTSSTRYITTETREGGVRVVGQSSRFRRSRRSELLIWWREIDRVLLALVLALVGIGIMAVAAASPASAYRLSKADKVLPEMYFFWLHLRWLGLGMVAMLFASMLPKQEQQQD